MLVARRQLILASSPGQSAAANIASFSRAGRRPNPPYEGTMFGRHHLVGAGQRGLDDLAPRPAAQRDVLRVRLVMLAAARETSADIARQLDVCAAAGEVWSFVVAIA